MCKPEGSKELWGRGYITDSQKLGDVRNECSRYPVAALLPHVMWIFSH